ncbi:hypothetical protein LIER_33173 [Lithospermum erythrorhizon]|uniref:Endonuclease/exonuclease/phosphatase domain-containing protein n=1 Tax=Lithospermum erythrorhizon TaxID=34254 RepID=A0AAV3RZC7_LITER
MRRASQNASTSAIRKAINLGDRKSTTCFLVRMLHIPNEVGRIWIVWRDQNISMFEVSRSDQHITCLVKDACHGEYCFYTSAIHGRNNKLERRGLWRSLCEDRVVVNHQPWIVGGDFNVIRSVEEAKGGKLPDSAAISEFNECLNTVGLMDVPHEGFQVLPDVESDHCSIDVKEVWSENINGHGMEIMHKKMKMLKESLKELNIREYSNISTRVIEKHHELVPIQTEVLNGYFDVVILNKAKQLEKEYVFLFHAERKLFKSKSRVIWAKDGDSSAKYFHSCMRTHYVKSKITVIEDSDRIMEYQKMKR